MTEEEAKTKVCCGHPYVAWAALATLPRAKIADVPTFDKCIASACMAWRWKRIANPDWKPASAQMAMWPAENPYSSSNPQSILSTTDGHCGLAGAPQ